MQKNYYLWSLVTEYRCCYLTFVLKQFCRNTFHLIFDTLKNAKPLLFLLVSSFCIFYLPLSFQPVSSLQTRQPVFVQLLQGVFRVYHCNWLVPAQKASVESCIKVLSDVGEYLITAMSTFNRLINDYKSSV